MEQLKSYMADNALTHEAMSDRIGISRAYLTQILNGSRSPGWRVQVKIEQATGGAVRAEVWINARFSEAREQLARAPADELADEVEP